MDFSIQNTGFAFAKCVLDTAITQEVTHEMIIPDSMPDVLSIIDVDGAVYLKSKDVESGKASAGGNVSLNIIYLPDGNEEPKKVTCDIPFSVLAKCGEVNTQSRMIATAVLSFSDSVIANSRKLSVKAEVTVTLKCYNDTGIQLCTGFDAPNEYELHCLSETKTVSTAISVREKICVLSQEYSVSASNPPIGELLKARSVIMTDEVKSVGNKLVIKGRTSTDIVYRAVGSSDIISDSFSEDYSQIIEMDVNCEKGAYDVFPMLTGAYYDTDMNGGDGNDNSLITELHIVLQCIVYGRTEIAYISDAYSTKYELEQTKDDISITNLSKSFSLGGIYKDTIEVSPKPSAILFASRYNGQITKTEDDRTVSFGSKQYVRIVYKDINGQINSCLHRININESCEKEPGIVYSADFGREESVYASVVGGVIELRISGAFTVNEFAETKADMISSLSTSEEAKSCRDYPSVIIHNTTEKDTLWYLAKRYNTTVDEIKNQNDLETDCILSGKKLMIIPKKR